MTNPESISRDCLLKAALPQNLWVKNCVQVQSGRQNNHGKTVSQEVLDGDNRTVAGKPLPVRLVITRLIDDDGFIVAQWTLLCNVFDAAVSACFSKATGKDLSSMNMAVGQTNHGHKNGPRALP